MRDAIPGESGSASRGLSAPRIAGFVLAVALGAVGVWMIVTAGSRQWTVIGSLAGFWGVLLGAFAVFGPGPHEAPRAAAAPGPGTALERAGSAVERAEYETRLVLMLRHEVQSTMTREVAQLRAEVAQLRTDLIEKVGGQLRLERIETTRVIGSDIEALQREIDLLKTQRPTTPVPAVYALAAAVDHEPDPDEAGRRRRQEDEGNDLLTEILARETSSGRHSRWPSARARR
ncbi:MAG: hypothetical protein EPN43_02485 [Jatrophihabitans sp.]|nr:MAG: hypothetical protein EPN43_02485 [Jatrophihabitans sp.]